MFQTRGASVAAADAACRKYVGEGKPRGRKIRIPAVESLISLQKDGYTKVYLAVGRLPSAQSRPPVNKDIHGSIPDPRAIDRNVERRQQPCASPTRHEKTSTACFTPNLAGPSDDMKIDGNATT